MGKSTCKRLSRRLTKDERRAQLDARRQEQLSRKPRDGWPSGEGTYRNPHRFG